MPVGIRVIAEPVFEFELTDERRPETVAVSRALTERGHSNQYCRSYEWRLLMCDDAAAGELYEALREELQEGLNLWFWQVGEPAYWTDEAITIADFPHEQRAAIEAAVERGYYRTPRELSLTDLAKAMNLPLSTLQYRLQQAESWIVQRFVAQSVVGRT